MSLYNAAAVFAAVSSQLTVFTVITQGCFVNITAFLVLCVLAVPQCLKISAL